MRLGLDYGGTKIEGVVLDAAGAERARARVPTPRHDYDGGIRAIRDLLGTLEGQAGGPSRRARSTSAVRRISASRSTSGGIVAAARTIASDIDGSAGRPDASGDNARTPAGSP